jgi:hypothetical protein
MSSTQPPSKLAHRYAGERVRAFYAERMERLERLERRHAILAATASEQASDARTDATTRQLVDELADIERKELQRIQNLGVVDNLLARRLQQALDLGPRATAPGSSDGSPLGPTSPLSYGFAHPSGIG